MEDSNEQSNEGAPKTLEERVTALEFSHLVLRAGLAENTRVTNAVKADTSSLVAFTEAMKGFGTLGRIIQRCLKWLAFYISPTVLAIVALWALITGKKVP